MWNMLTKTFEFLSEKARGLILTLGSTGLGTASQAAGKAAVKVPEVSYTLENIQIWAYTASFVVAVLTIISYGYKFVLFCKKSRKKDK